MFAKRLLQKATQNHHHLHRQQHDLKGFLTPADLDFRIPVHCGIPSTASVLAFDPIQRLLAVGTLDGRIKVIGGDNIEGILISPQQLPYKYLEFLSNQGYLVSISNDNIIEIWNLEIRSITSSLQWESNITAFALIQGSHFMYIGDEYGMLSVLKHEAENGEIFLLPYHISADTVSEAAGSSISNHQPIVGVLPQPCSSGNRLVIAYESGLIVLWDIAQAQVLLVRGDKILELKDIDSSIDSSSEVAPLPDVTHGYNLEEKEISALCWASTNGSILAAGYVDGDILFWKTATSTKGQKGGRSCNNVIKLQLSSAERRIPVIVLHWSANSKSQHDGDGQLFIYGGDEIGSDEVLTVLSLEWRPGMETVRCVGRADLTLTGSFADMILLPRPSAILNCQIADLFVLTSPGHLQFFSHDSLSGLASQHEERVTLSSLEFPLVIPAINPTMTVAKLIVLPQGEKSSRFLSEIATHIKHDSTPSLNVQKWPLSGGVANQLSFSGNDTAHRIYIAGYLDGSVRIWNATSPVFSLLCVIHGKIKGVEVAGVGASVLELDFCSSTLSLAVGNELGLIRIYNLNASSKETGFHIVSETRNDVHNLPQDDGLNCRGGFTLLNSPVHILRYEHNGDRLSVGYKCGRVAVLDVHLFSVLFLTNSPSNPSSPVISMMWTSLVLNDGHPKSPKHKAPKNPDKPSKELIFVLTKDAKVYVFDSANGDMVNSGAMSLKKESTALSINVLDDNTLSPKVFSQKPLEQTSKDAILKNEPSGDTNSKLDKPEIEHESSPKCVQSPGRSSMESLVLICCKDALCLYRLKSVLQGDGKAICKINLSKPCCWSSTVMKDGRICGLVLLYETGDIEVRSLPDLELVKEASLMSTLRWNFKASMNRTMTSTDCGLISLANGYEVAFISLLTNENYFRMPESLPSLHDNVLAAAAEAAISSSKKKQGGPGVLGNIVKGLKGGKGNNKIDIDPISKLDSTHLDEVFARNPFPDPSQTIIESHEESDLDIDEIEIDEPASTSSHTEHHNDTRKRTDREKLFDGAGSDPAPRLRTREEIIATYRKTGDASSVAGEARNKLLERQEKLERISKRTEDLRSGAEDFASLANELVKQMERRKWWQI